QQGYTVYAVEQTDNSTMLNDLIVDSNKKIAMVFGNEVSGVEAATIAICDGCVEIPQMGMKHSLNISVAAGVVLWELVRKVFIK
ncbi:MAG: TrmH family RNA methyltransferase, partial [Flavihumibacter sp.]|nr:TrmH family RNA methyltransferase [Flavihumibacter sp.]